MEKTETGPRKVSPVEVVNKLKTFRFYSPALRDANELALNKVSSQIPKGKIDFSFEQSLQFSPIRYAKSPDFRIPLKKAKKSINFAPTLIKSSRNHASPTKLIKNNTEKTLAIKSPQIPVKFLSPKQLTTRKSTKTVKIRMAEGKVWRKILNASNGIESNPSFFVNYSVFVGKGNNSSLVKKIILSRNWWTLTEDKERANFVWTQWKDKNYLATLPCLTGKKFEVETGEEMKDLPAGLKLIVGSASYCSVGCEKYSPESTKMHNKIEFNNHLSNKKSLFFTLKDFYENTEVDVFSKVPLTFHISQKTLDPEFSKFSQKFLEFNRYKELHPNFQNIWIVKPGEFTNRGQGISVCKTLEDIQKLIESAEHTLIVQKYIESPLLISKRKFDIRCYSLMTCINGIMQGYFYLDGYLRTASQEFNIKDCGNLFVHLTNDAIQKNSKEYGKYENGNKLSYRDFQKYLERRFPDRKPNFSAEILPVIKSMVKDTMLASFERLDTNKRGNCMEIFGYDFMIDRALKPWLIEVNTNPCLELSSQYLSALIPAMLENAFRITLDTVFPPPVGEYIEFGYENRFELIFHELVDGNKKEKVEQG